MTLRCLWFLQGLVEVLGEGDGHKRMENMDHLHGRHAASRVQPGVPAGQTGPSKTPSAARRGEDVQAQAKAVLVHAHKAAEDVAGDLSYLVRQHGGDRGLAQDASALPDALVLQHLVKTQEITGR